MDRSLLESRIQLRHVRCFVAVCQARHLGRAAERLHLTQPAVSKTMSEFEAIVGARLLDRGRHGARPTREGERLLPHALAALEALGRAARAADPTAPAAATVHVGALPTVAPDLLPAALLAFRRTHPDSRVVLQTATNAALLELLRAGTVDLVIGRMSDPAPTAGLTFELLYIEPLVLAVRPQHPLAGIKRVALDRVLGHPLVVCAGGTAPRQNTESFLVTHGLRLPSNCLETLSLPVARLVVQHSDAVWFAPAGAVREDRRAGALVWLDVSTTGTEEPVGLLQRREGRLAAPAQALVQALRASATARHRPGARPRFVSDRPPR